METIFYIKIIAASLIAIGAAFLFYKKQKGLSGPVRMALVVFRTMSLLALLLLLLNPKITRRVNFQEKPVLGVFIDNSASIKTVKADSVIKQLYQEISTNKALDNKFDVQFLKFGANVSLLDSITFNAQETALDKVMDYAAEALPINSPLLLLTDGNQTEGNALQYHKALRDFSVFPIVVGDSTTYTDARITLVNHNPYAYLTNAFPVEVHINYEGQNNVNGFVRLSAKGKELDRKKLVFSPKNNSAVHTFMVKATDLGLQNYQVEIVIPETEKNTNNNLRRFSVEVLDERLKIALIRTYAHPDIGALKRSLNTNNQREINVVTPEAFLQDASDYALAIAYQPDARFKEFFDSYKLNPFNLWIISGPHTNWDLINNSNFPFNKEARPFTEQVTASTNAAYTHFIFEDIGFNTLPPLSTHFGNFKAISSNSVLLWQHVNGIQTKNPILATKEALDVKSAIWDGSGLWKWRAAIYNTDNGFKSFDDGINKLVQYLASTQKKTRLQVNSATQYTNTDRPLIQSIYLDKNYTIKPDGTLTLNLKHIETNVERTFPMRFQNGSYVLKLPALEKGTYNYTVTVADENIQAKGRFLVLQSEKESQFYKAHYKAMAATAHASNTGAAFYNPSAQEIINTLLNNPQYKPIIKTEENTVPLVEWKLLLIVLLLLLALEWFARKYYGLI